MGKIPNILQFLMCDPNLSIAFLKQMFMSRFHTPVKENSLLPDEAFSILGRTSVLPHLFIFASPSQFPFIGTYDTWATPRCYLQAQFC